MQYRPSFSELIDRFGEVMAWHYLAEIEQAAHIKPQRGVADPEIRLASALRAQDAMHEPAVLMAA